MAAPWLVLGLLFSFWPPCDGGKIKEKRTAQRMNEDVGMSQADLRIAYGLFDVLNQFPADAVAEASPLGWRVATALGEASALEPQVTRQICCG